MASLAHQRCFNHAWREAAARCPECAQFYCRECITEHEDRVICASCLKKLSRRAAPRKHGLILLWRATQFLAGLFLVWLFFYWVGEGLLSLSSSFHQTTVWKDNWFDELDEP